MRPISATPRFKDFGLLFGSHNLDAAEGLQRPANLRVAMLPCFFNPSPSLFRQIRGDLLISPEIGLPNGQYLALTLGYALLDAVQRGPGRLHLVPGRPLFVVVEHL